MNSRDEALNSRDERAIEHETAFVRAFVIRERRDRYLAFLASSKKRNSFLDRLNHRFYRDLDGRWVCKGRPPRLPAAESLCYIMADEKEYDGRIVLASDVPGILSAAYFGIIVSYVPGKLAAYKDEVPADVVWLSRD